MPTVGLTLKGTSSLIANQLIVDTFDLGGNGTLTVQYDGRNPVTINNVFLVE
jgi:hypothetical protein